MSSPRYLTGGSKVVLYVRIAVHVVLRYLPLVRSPLGYARFLLRALRLLRVFVPHKAVRVAGGFKLHLYLPAYPSEAFFYALESKLLRTPPGPVTIVFSMTKRCTYKCPHCYQRRDANEDVPEELLLETTRNLRDAGVAMFDVEGGDPFLRFERLRKVLQELDERAEVWVNSTGANVDVPKLEQLKRDGLFGLMISVHSPDPEKHDAFTGIPGSFVMACDVARMCRELGLALALNSVLSEGEIKAGHLDRLMDLARDLDADYVQLIHPKPAGKWLENTEQMQREHALIERVRAEHRRYNSSTAAGHPALAAQVAEEAPGSLGCTAGAVDRFYVNAAGEMQPCEFLNLSFGNLNEESFETVFRRMRSYFPVPGVDWLCCTQAEAVAALMKKHGLTRTPVPWKYARELVETWDRGTPTPLYKDLGIYE